jgi:DNA polymerase III alpha subunit (gram-positive type)
MNLVVLNVATTGFSVAEDDVYFVGALRIDADSGRLVSSFSNHVKPERFGIPAFREYAGLLHLTEADFESLPKVSEVLVSLSRFVEKDAVIAHRGPVRDMPVVREQCARHGLPVRPVRIMDSADMARELLGSNTDVTLRKLAKRFRLMDDQTPTPLGPVRHLEILGEVVQRMWALLAPENGSFPVAYGTGVLPVTDLP